MDAGKLFAKRKDAMIALLDMLIALSGVFVVVGLIGLYFLNDDVAMRRRVENFFDASVDPQSGFKWCTSSATSISPRCFVSQKS